MRPTLPLPFIVRARSGIGWGAVTLGGVALGLASLMSPPDDTGAAGRAVRLVVDLPSPLLVAILALLSLTALLLLVLLLPRRVRWRRKEDEEFQLYHEPPKLSPLALIVLLALALFPVALAAYLVRLDWAPGLDIRVAPPSISSVPAPTPPGSEAGHPATRPDVSLPLFSGAVGLLAFLGALGSLGLLLWIFLGDHLARWWGTPFAGAPAAEPLIEAIESSLDDLRREPDARRAIIRCYRRFEQWLAASGLPRAPWKTPSEFMRDALGRLPLPAEALRALTGLFEVSRFSEHRLGPEEREVALASLIEIKAALEEAASHAAAT
jgi:hypothetical protein